MPLAYQYVIQEEYNPELPVDLGMGSWFKEQSDLQFARAEAINNSSSDEWVLGQHGKDISSGLAAADGFIYLFLHAAWPKRTWDLEGEVLLSLGTAGTGTVAKTGVKATGKALLGSVDDVAPTTLPVPSAPMTLGKWGEMRLKLFLRGQGTEKVRLVTSAGKRREVDRLVNRIAHESKAGVNVKLTTTHRRQAIRDKALIEEGAIDGAHWHFWQGAEKKMLDFLDKLEIPYTVH